MKLSPQRRNPEALRRYSFADCLRRHGYSYRQIGQRMNVSIERARQLVLSHRRVVSDELETLQFTLRQAAFDLKRKGL